MHKAIQESCLKGLKQTAVPQIPAVSAIYIMDATRLCSDLNKPEALIRVEISTKNKQRCSKERIWPSFIINKL